MRFGGIPEGSLNGENLRGLELNWIFENDVKGDLDISEGTQGPIAKIMHDLFTEWWELWIFCGKRVGETSSKF